MTQPFAYDAATAFWIAAALVNIACSFWSLFNFERSWKRARELGWQRGVMEGHHITLFPNSKTATEAKEYLDRVKPHWIIDRKNDLFWKLAANWVPDKQGHL